MHIDLLVVLASLLVGMLVGTTGMGGGALMTPVLVLLFGVQPLAAISSDLVSAAVMKPVGGAVHLRRGTVDTTVVRWLAVGSVPAAFAGVLVLRAVGDAGGVQKGLTVILGTALLLATAAIVAKGLASRLRPSRSRALSTEPGPTGRSHPVRAKAPAIVGIGALGGLVVGMTSVGSGSLMIVLLMFACPWLSLSVLVGTDLVQAVPLVAAAALGHLVFGDVRLGLTASLIVGSVPGTYLGARLSSRAPDHIIRPALALVLLLSGLKLVGVSTVVLGWSLGVTLVLAGLALGLNRRRGRWLPGMGRGGLRGAAPTPGLPGR